MTTEKLLVCSVFSGSELDRLWLGLQREYLGSTVGEFDHAVYLGHRADPALFEGCKVAGTAAPGSKREHLNGLLALSAFCRENSYSGYLILDCDAFPIMPNWEETLRFYIKRFNKRCATAIRTENLDTFPHPCVVYTQDPGALQWGMKPGINLMGRPVTDVTCLEGEVFPMLKTNRLNVHPTLATVYFDMFYHHGAGTRVFSMRATNCGYYDHVLLNGRPDSEELLSRLQTDPQAFVASLHG